MSSTTITITSVYMATF